MHTLDITEQVRIPMSEIRMVAMRSQGAGGQNVNKVATAIHLHFDSQASSALSTAVKNRIMHLADRRVTEDGTIVIKSQAHRSQARNREAALDRLAEIIQRALKRSRPRIATKPGRKAREQRLDSKSRRGNLKKTRQRVTHDD